MQVQLDHPNAKPPTKKSALDAGYDLSAAEAVTLPPRGRAIVPTGLRISLPEGYYARIAPRSGLAVKHCIDVAAGVCDPGYRGLYGVVLINDSDNPYTVEVGDRIAQLIVTPYSNPEVTIVGSLDETTRGEGGFGSTGK
jgi:dUTP pyrophosphatase